MMNRETLSDEQRKMRRRGICRIRKEVLVKGGNRPASWVPSPIDGNYIKLWALLRKFTPPRLALLDSGYRNYVLPLSGVERPIYHDKFLSGIRVGWMSHGTRLLVESYARLQWYKSVGLPEKATIERCVNCGRAPTSAESLRQFAVYEDMWRCKTLPIGDNSSRLPTPSWRIYRELHPRTGRADDYCGRMCRISHGEKILAALAAIARLEARQKIQQQKVTKCLQQR